MNKRIYNPSELVQNSRRQFLEFIGKSGATGAVLKHMPILAGLMANRYANASNNPVRRVVFVYTPLGSPAGVWLPVDGKLNLATQGFSGVENDCHFHETEVVSAELGLIRKALGELRWNADWTGDTIDNQIATVLGASSPYAALNFSVQASPSIADALSRKNGRGVLSMDTPSQAMAALFSSGALEMSIARQQAKSSLLAGHADALKCSQSLLSQEEKQTVEQLDDTISWLSRKLENTPNHTLACETPAFALPEPSGITFMEEARLQSDLMVHALSCGLTNVATLQLSDDQGNFVGSDPDFTGSMHQATCGSPGPEHYINMLNDLNGCIAHLIEQLAMHDDPAVPGTKLLDNTVVVQVSSIGHGPSHSSVGGPSVIATRMPQFKTGIATPQGSDNNLQILQTVAIGLGLEQYIGKESHHCIWPGGGSPESIASTFLT